MADVRQSIRERLADGPVWTRSFQQVKPMLDRMIRDGEVLRCKPFGGRANNMVCLASQQEPVVRLSLVELFAERLSMHGDVRKAADEVGQTTMRGWQRFDEMCRALGPQAV